MADLITMVPVVIGEEAFEESRKLVVECLFNDERKCLRVYFDEIGKFVQLG